MLIETLRADWAARATQVRVSALPDYANGGLTLGAGTRLADPDVKDSATEADRAIALLSVALGRRLDASQCAHAHRALAKAREGDAPLALTHLALAGVGRLDDPREDARRLFIADGLMNAGVAPATILEALGDAPASNDLDRAYNPDQPRVPAGNGIVSGRWAARDWSGAEGSTTQTDEKPARGVQVVDASTTRGSETRSDASTPGASSAPPAPSALQSFLTVVLRWLPGTQYSALAVEAWHSGDYLNFALYEGAATLEAALLLAPALSVSSVGTEAISTEASAALQTLTLDERRAIQLTANKLAGEAFEAQAGGRLEALGVDAENELTLQTHSGVKTRLDYLSHDPTTNAIRCIECKASETAPLTPNQEAAFPEIESSGATIVGAGKPGFPGGTIIPPTPVEVIRPSNLDDLNFWTPA